MSVPSNEHGPEHSNLLRLYALQALPDRGLPAMRARLAECSECRRELEALRSVVDFFVARPGAILRPTDRLWELLASRLADDSRDAPVGVAEATLFEDHWEEPEWKEASPGLWYQLLSTDDESQRITLLVRLEPGVEYPPHEHAGLEELHLLDGELWIDDRKLRPGDYNRAEPGTSDRRVGSETGCTCVLITSHRDVLR